MKRKNFFDKFKRDREFQKYYQEASELLDIAIAIAEARRRRRLSQIQLARKVGMPQSQIARLESGQRNVTVETLSRVASALNLKLRLASAR